MAVRLRTSVRGRRRAYIILLVTGVVGAVGGPLPRAIHATRGHILCGQIEGAAPLGPPSSTIPPKSNECKSFGKKKKKNSAANHFLTILG